MSTNSPKEIIVTAPAEVWARLMACVASYRDASVRFDQAAEVGGTGQDGDPGEDLWNAREDLAQCASEFVAAASPTETEPER